MDAYEEVRHPFFSLVASTENVLSRGTYASGTPLEHTKGRTLKMLESCRSASTLGSMSFVHVVLKEVCGIFPFPPKRAQGLLSRYVFTPVITSSTVTVAYRWQHRIRRSVRDQPFYFPTLAFARHKDETIVRPLAFIFRPKVNSDRAPEYY